MKKIAAVGIVALVVLCIASPSVNAGINSARVCGYILDDAGNPIDEALVEWKNNATGVLLKECTTNIGGYYNMQHTFDGTIESLVIASKTCYITNSTVISTTADFPPETYQVNLTLEEDTIGPTITNLQPADGSFINDTTPAICANYSDPSGINVSSVKIFVDDNDETANATVEEDYVCYTSITALLDGLHNVTVNVSDNCTNSNSTSWLFTVDTIAPTIEFIEPPTPVNNTEVNVSYVNVSVNVTDYSSGIDNATVVMVWNETGYPMTEYMYAFTEGKYYCVVLNLKNGNYTYWVQANDIAGNMNVSETRVVTVNATEYTVSVTLESGWNMIGVPLNVSAWGLPGVLESIENKYDYVCYYNATTGEMDYYDPLDPGDSTLKTLEPGAGYLISMTEDAIVSFEGTKLIGLERSLETDWNMFSVPYGVVNETLPTVLESIEGKYDYICYYNATTGEMDYYDPLDPGDSTLKTLEPGAGYLISMTEPAIFIPDMGI